VRANLLLNVPDLLAAAGRSVAWETIAERYQYFSSPSTVLKCLSLVCARHRLAVIKEEDRSRLSRTKRALCPEEACDACVTLQRVCEDPNLLPKATESRWRISSLSLTHIHEVCFKFDESRAGPPREDAATAAANRSDLIASLAKAHVALPLAAKCLNAAGGGPKLTKEAVARLLQGLAPSGGSGPANDIADMVREINSCQDKGGVAVLITSNDLPLWERPAGQKFPANVPSQDDNPAGAGAADLRAVVWMDRAQLVLARAFGCLLSVDAQARVVK
jgi:hypothetical protein